MRAWDRMLTKLDQVRKLLADGYTLDEVESEGGVMVARFRKATKTTTIRFLPSDAEAVLLTRGPLRLEGRWAQK